VIDLQNDKTLLVASEDIEKDIIDIRFKLDLEMYPCEELQKAYTATGLELFSIEPLPHRNLSGRPCIASENRNAKTFPKRRQTVSFLISCRIPSTASLMASSVSNNLGLSMPSFSRS
jgi:hypothetical protein